MQFLSRNSGCRVVIVEKTDRLYRNFRDCVTLEDLDVEIHLPREGQVISNNSKSQAGDSVEADQHSVLIAITIPGSI